MSGTEGREMSVAQASRGAAAGLTESTGPGQEALGQALDAGGIGAWEVDLVSGRLIWSPTLARIHGHQDDARERTLHDYEGDVHPEDRERVHAAITVAGRKGAVPHLHYRVVRPDGEVRWLEARGTLVRGDGGVSPRIVGVCLDVTDREEARRKLAGALRQAEQARRDLQEILAHAPAAITLTRGPDHVVESQNALAREQGGIDIIGRPLREVLPELGAAEFVALYDEVYRTGEPYVGREIEVRWTDAEGRPRREDVNLVLQPLFDLDGRVHGLLSHSTEVTELVQARREVEQKAEELGRLAAALQQSNRELDQFAYVASHDLKAPLRAIANLSQWLEEDLGPRLGDENRAHLQLLRSRVHRMESLIDGILEYSRAGRVPSPRAEVDLGQLFAEVVDLISPIPPARVVCEGPFPTFTAERVPLQQVLINLIGNALKHGGPAVTVTVSATTQEDAVHIVVRDDGPGVAPEFHERIWGLFQTLRSRDEVEGAGIGLSVVKKNVESRGGRAWLESRPGEGAAFHVVWPLRPWVGRNPA